MTSDLVTKDTKRLLKLSVIIPAYNASKTLPSCLAAVMASDYANYECIVVDDCSSDDTGQIAEQFSARVLTLEGGPYGPGYARNRGAEIATGDVVFFVDADVLITPPTVSKVAETFVANPGISAMFGSYDDDPQAGAFSSQFKNLFHHFVHQQGQERAVTFWSGCGAVRRQVFLESGGFDADRYPRPSIEDIELGYRLTAAGHQIMVNKEVQVKHLKHWTIRGMIKADIVDRGYTLDPVDTPREKPTQRPQFGPFPAGQRAHPLCPHNAPGSNRLFSQHSAAPSSGCRIFRCGGVLELV